MSILHPIRISCLALAEQAAKEHNAEMAITILDAGTPPPEFANVPSVKKRVRFFFNDQESSVAEGMKDAVADVVRIGQSWSSDGARPRLLVHCHGGISRSTAAAYILMCASSPSVLPHVHFKQLLSMTNKPWPNLRMVEMAEELLKTNGLMAEPLLAYRAKYPKRIEAYGKVNARRGLPSTYKR